MLIDNDASRFLMTFPGIVPPNLENRITNSVFRIAAVVYKSGFFASRIVFCTSDKAMHRKCRVLLSRHGRSTILVAHRWRLSWKVVAWYGIRPVSAASREEIAEKFCAILRTLTPEEAWSDGDDPADYNPVVQLRRKPLERYPIPPNPHEIRTRPCPDAPAPGNGNSDCAIPDTCYDYSSS